MPGAIVAAPSSHRYSIPDAHQRQCPHTATNDITTWSPGTKPVTPSPISTTVPAPSWPPTMGNIGIRPYLRATSLETDMSPLRMWSSEWHRPAAAISTSTSPVRGGSSSKSSTDRGPPTSCRIAARLLICSLVLPAQPAWAIGDGKCLRRSERHTDDLAVLVGHQLQVGHAIEEAVEHRPRFHPRQMHAEAAVNAARDGDVRATRPANVEHVGVGPP